MSNKKLEYVQSGLIILNGIICLAYSEKLIGLLPIICGAILLIRGLVQFIEGIKDKDYLSLEKMNLEKSFISISIGIGVLVRGREALFIIGMFWGLHGLIKAANYLNIALYNLFNKDKWIVILIKSIIEFSLSFVLVFDPFGKIGHHIIILGLELIFDGCMDFMNKYQEKKLSDLV